MAYGGFDETPLLVERDGVRLAGSLWQPAGTARAVVLMHPGSGPSDRHNDGYFAPIRTHLLGRGVAVGAFDKRGVGTSSGDWRAAGIDEQAADAAACLEQVAARLPGVPCGVFGHSQGGWVVVELASRRDDLAFVVASSGPGVTPAAQERYATTLRLTEHARDRAEFGAAMRCFDLVVTCMSSGVGFDDAVELIAAAGLADVFARSELFSFPLADAALWPLSARLIEHDPRPALRAVRAPTLALFGAPDRAVPVHASVAAYRACVPAELLDVAVLAGADHRLQRHDQLPDEYFAALDRFLDAAVERAERAGYHHGRHTPLVD